MSAYWIYFEFLGKKMKIKIYAKTEDEARQEVYKKLTIHKTEKEKDVLDKVFDDVAQKNRDEFIRQFGDIFNFKK